MTRDIFEAAQEAFIDNYLAEHPDADEQEAEDAFWQLAGNYVPAFTSEIYDNALQRREDRRHG